MHETTFADIDLSKFLFKINHAFIEEEEDNSS